MPDFTADADRAILKAVLDDINDNARGNVGMFSSQYLDEDVLKETALSRSKQAATALNGLPANEIAGVSWFDGFMFGAGFMSRKHEQDGS